MRSLKVRFALLLVGTALLVMLAAAGVFWSTTLSERTIDRVLAAQYRLELLAELSGRLTQFGLAAVETLGNPDAPPEAVSVTREAVDKALNKVEAAVGGRLANSADRAEQIQYMARTRPLMKLRSARVVLDRQVYQIQRELESNKRKDSIQGALNGFGAMTGPPLSLLIESERRAMAAGSEEARAVSQRMRTLSIVGLTAALIIVLVLYRSVTRPTLARIEAVRNAAGAVGSGALDIRLSVAPRDELGLLVANFNRMVARLGRRERHVAADRAALEETIEARTADLRSANERLEMVDRSRRRFFADVSHELRTPLTVILGECDLATRAQAKALDHGAVFATIRKRAQGLKRRVEDLLRVARSESGQIELDRRPVSAIAVLTSAAEGASAEAAKRRVALVIEPGERDLEIEADPEWLRQVVESLADNALRHANGLTRIVIALEKRQDWQDTYARLTVTDDGSGFPENGEALFERFKRDGRSGEPGFGIGLALARWVVERHDGSISLGSGHDGRGARVTIDLPVGERTAMDVRAGRASQRAGAV